MQHSWFASIGPVLFEVTALSPNRRLGGEGIPNIDTPAYADIGKPAADKTAHGRAVVQPPLIVWKARN
jgi:hypothetical protein